MVNGIYHEMPLKILLATKHVRKQIEFDHALLNVVLLLDNITHESFKYFLNVYLRTVSFLRFPKQFKYYSRCIKSAMSL